MVQILVKKRICLLSMISDLLWLAFQIRWQTDALCAACILHMGKNPWKQGSCPCRNQFLQINVYMHSKWVVKEKKERLALNCGHVPPLERAARFHTERCIVIIIQCSLFQYDTTQSQYLLSILRHIQKMEGSFRLVSYSCCSCFIAIVFVSSLLFLFHSYRSCFFAIVYHRSECYFMSVVPEFWASKHSASGVATVENELRVSRELNVCFFNDFI